MGCVRAFALVSIVRPSDHISTRWSRLNPPPPARATILEEPSGRLDTLDMIREEGFGLGDVV
jgi:hypothetical protein